ncbi:MULTISPECIES: 3-hydroxyacyl-CoA dehydrogenase [unclassified Chelatococcus]|uniref:3-hydroxyacyl-CoA dehydrogenase n=1 Tax=unclassified Chelatococcus TaxID=2638111 RepID=UPI001BD06C3D|nr:MULTISPECIES: 3-hydroxyacyl-CoA dehydrogenase [unclassified Chelatococcus]MBS7699675.1 3-hydroxyacyl-CoA dehydrogenase [Chelatococcus sp. YT9]MBX3557127.1 3-hydroxyacyl-CoA dehydrogenase [Chelatococcus sp.]
MATIMESRLILGIVGAGAMGSGIAQVASAAGVEVRLFDTRAGAAEAARGDIARRLRKRVDEGKLKTEEAEASISCVVAVDVLAALADCNVVIEAIVENLEAKRSLFKALEDIVGQDTILASNTSSLPIGAIAAGLRHRGRVGGLHFFNPVPLMRLVEVIPGPETTDVVVAALTDLGRRLGREPVLVRDTPGFLVNLGGRAYATEALAILHENIASPAEIDAVMRDCCGFRMGPFELMDLTGIDVNFPVTRFVHESFFGDPRLRSTPYHRYLMETGQLGRKTGRGFYAYGSHAGKPSADATSAGGAPAQVVLVERCDRLVKFADELGLRCLASDDGTSPLLCAPLGEDATAFATRHGVDARRLIALDLSFDTSKRVTVMTAPGSDLAMRQAIIDTLIARGRSVTAIADSPGFIAQRIVAMVANLGCEMAQAGLAAPRDIDKAMRLGLNYPQGPLEFVESCGARNILAILTTLQALTGDDRYRPSQWLRRRASLGVPVWTE